MPKGAKLFKLFKDGLKMERERKKRLCMLKLHLCLRMIYLFASGHWSHYKDGMFVLGDEEKDAEIMALRPMTCPFNLQFITQNNIATEIFL